MSDTSKGDEKSHHLTPGGAPDADYQRNWGILEGARFPVAPGDNERGRRALRLRGHGTSKTERAKILDVVARRCPALKKVVDLAREEDKKAGLI